MRIYHVIDSDGYWLGEVKSMKDARTLCLMQNMPATISRGFYKGDRYKSETTIYEYDGKNFKRPPAMQILTLDAPLPKRFSK